MLSEQRAAGSGVAEGAMPGTRQAAGAAALPGRAGVLFFSAAGPKIQVFVLYSFSFSLGWQRLCVSLRSLIVTLV